VQKFLEYQAPTFVRHGPVTVPGGGAGTPAVNSARTGVGDIQGPFAALTVYAKIGVDWANAWIRLVGRLSSTDVPLDLKQGRDIQLPFEAPLAIGGAPSGTRTGLLFHVTGRPFDRYEVQVYNPAGAAPLSAAEFILIGQTHLGAPSGDRAHRAVVDPHARTNQQQPFNVQPAVVGAPQPMGAANPNGGDLFLTSIAWTAQGGGVSTLQIASSTGPTVLASYTMPAAGGAVTQTFPVPLRTVARGDQFQYTITGGGPHSLTAQIHQE
jgi:hypothetical protein